MEVVTEESGRLMQPLRQKVTNGALAWLSGGGEMGKLVRTMDWSKTPLGPIESWPQSLRTTVSLCLASNFPISIAWGPQHIQIYNDGYWPICGAKHPHSMGQDFTECWASPWPAIGGAFEQALGGQAAYLENQRMFLDRNGYVEETFFTFSFSPVRDESGEVGGLFHPVTEMTLKTIGERRIRAVKDIAERTGNTRSIEEACAVIIETLRSCTLDVPFAVIYRLDDAGKTARLERYTGVRLGTPAAPDHINLSGTNANEWPLDRVVHSGQAVEVNDIVGRFGRNFSSPYEEPPQTALLLPVRAPGVLRPLGILVAGVSTRRELDESYRSFYQMLGNAVSTALGNARSYQEERKRAEALAELDRAKTLFFSNISHEFRTPLTLILGPAQDMLNETKGPLPEYLKSEVEVLHRNSLRLLKLVNSVLDFARIEAGRIDASFEPTDLSTYTAELASSFQSAMDRAGLKLVIDCEKAPEPYYVDREMWEKVVLNLISNAFKFTFEGEVRVSVRYEKENAHLRVSDTGTGIPEADLPKVFERFCRVQGAKSRTFEGTGIGLALVKELVRLHGGSIEASSTMGKGSAFTVLLPRGTAHLPPEKIGNKKVLSSTEVKGAHFLEEAKSWMSDPDTPLASSGRAPSEHPLPYRARILLADDNQDMRNYVKRLLSQYWEVETVSDGLSALTRAKELQPDLILSDIMMPNLNGIELLRELKASTETKDIPVILLSARAGEEAKVEGIDKGADDYLVKPFSAKELLSRVNNLLLKHRHSIETLRKKNEELSRLIAELETFAYVSSHDLKEPLRMVRTYVQFLAKKLEGKLGKDERLYMSFVTEGANRMYNLINDLLEFSSIGSSPNGHQVVDCNLALDAAEANLRATIDESGAKITRTDLPAVKGDRAQLVQVFQNLLSNAMKFKGDKTPEIYVNARRRGEFWEFSVRDNGIGIDPQYKDRIFVVFQRLHDRKSYPGTGIGLSICKKIVERHGGEIRVVSEPGQGATFVFTLPGLPATAEGVGE